MTKGYQQSAPTFTVDAAKLPEIKTWKVGSKYTVTADVKMTGPGTFEILTIAPEDDSADEGDDSE